MSEEATGLLASATPTPEIPETPAAIPHRAEAPDPGTSAPSEAQDGAAWVGTMSKSLYKDGKPNYDVLPQKYWEGTNPRLDKALEARAELEKKFSRGEHKAPEAYDLGVLKAVGMPDDDPLAGSVVAWAKEQGISQDAFNKLAQSYVEIMGQVAQQAQVNIEQEKAKLGPQADKVIEDMTGWARSLVSKGIWGPDDFEEFKVMGGTASGLKALMKVRQYYGDIAKIPVMPQQPEGMPSKEELQAMVGDPRYATDPAFRQKVERLFEKAFG